MSGMFPFSAKTPGSARSGAHSGRSNNSHPSPVVGTFAGESTSSSDATDVSEYYDVHHIDPSDQPRTSIQDIAKTAARLGLDKLEEKYPTPRQHEAPHGVPSSSGGNSPGVSQPSLEGGHFRGANGEVRQLHPGVARGIFEALKDSGVPHAIPRKHAHGSALTGLGTAASAAGRHPEAAMMGHGRLTGSSALDRKVPQHLVRGAPGADLHSNPNRSPQVVGHARVRSGMHASPDRGAQHGKDMGQSAMSRLARQRSPHGSSPPRRRHSPHTDRVASCQDNMQPHQGAHTDRAVTYGRTKIPRGNSSSTTAGMSPSDEVTSRAGRFGFGQGFSSPESAMSMGTGLPPVSPPTSPHRFSRDSPQSHTSPGVRSNGRGSDSGRYKFVSEQREIEAVVARHQTDPDVYDRYRQHRSLNSPASHNTPRRITARHANIVPHRSQSPEVKKKRKKSWNLCCCCRRNYKTADAKAVIQNSRDLNANLAFAKNGMNGAAGYGATMSSGSPNSVYREEYASQHEAYYTRI